MADDHTRDHFRWLMQIGGDDAVPATGFKLAFIIGQHFNRETGLAWPGQDLLAEFVGADVRTVRRLADQLAERGHLEIRKRKGPHHANVYRALHRTPASGSDDATPDTGVRSDDQHTGHGYPVQNSHRTFDAATPDISRTHTGHPCPQNLLEPLQNLKRAERHDWFLKNQSSFACYVTNVDDRWNRWCVFLGVKSLWPDKRGGRMFPAYDPPAEIQLPQSVEGTCHEREQNRAADRASAP